MNAKLVALAIALPTLAQAPKPAPHHATGTFDVKMHPQKADNPQAEGAGFGRLSMDKQFHGDLEAASQGEMLAEGNGAPGSSGGYVALERVKGTLQGRAGSFAFMHSGTLVRGVPTMLVTVVPGSGTGALAGLEGKMTIRIEAGKHSFDFDYTLPEP
jgi:hypothetical protein